jgi:hypothetical protein
MFNGSSAVGGTAFYRRLVLVVVVTLVVIVGAFAVYRHTRQSPYLHVLGRNYIRSPGVVETLKQIRVDGAKPIIVNDRSFVDRSAYPPNEQPEEVFIRHGSVYWDYVLSGGP